MEGFPELLQNKLCMWTFMLLVFCFSSSCCLNFGKSIIGREGDDSNRRDICAFYCCGMFPFLARLADSDGIVVPRGMRKLKALHTLGIVNIAHGKAILQEIKRLTRLRKLAVTGINKKNCQEFCSTLVHLSSLESLLVDSREERSSWLLGWPALASENPPEPQAARRPDQIARMGRAPPESCEVEARVDQANGGGWHRRNAWQSTKPGQPSSTELVFPD